MNRRPWWKRFWSWLTKPAPKPIVFEGDGDDAPDVDRSKAFVVDANGQARNLPKGEARPGSWEAENQ